MADIPPLALPLPDGLTRHEALIATWIGSDLPLLEQMRYVATGNEFVADDVQLATTLSDMLYDPAYGRRLPDLFHVAANCGDARKALIARRSISVDAFHDIDLEGWARIRAALLAGTEGTL